MDKLAIVRYSKDGSHWVTVTDISLRIANKQATLLTANGYEVQIETLDRSPSSTGHSRAAH